MQLRLSTLDYIVSNKVHYNSKTYRFTNKNIQPIIFFNCRQAQAVWRGMNIPYPALTDNASSFEMKFKAIIDCHNIRQLLPLTRQLPLWRIWKSRNLLVYQKKSSEWRGDVSKAIDEAKECTNCWHEEQANANHSTTSNRSRSVWLKPQERYIKCNYDRRFQANGNPSKVEWVMRDANGTYLEAGQS